MNPILRPVILFSVGLIVFSIILIFWFSANKKLGKMSITEIKNSKSTDKHIGSVKRSLNLFYFAVVVFLIAVSIDIGIVVYDWYINLNQPKPNDSLDIFSKGFG